MEAQFKNLYDVYRREIAITPDERASKREYFLQSGSETPDIESSFVERQATYQNQLSITIDERATHLHDHKAQQEKKANDEKKLYDYPCPQCFNVPCVGDLNFSEDYDLSCSKCKTPYRNRRPELPYRASRAEGADVPVLPLKPLEPLDATSLINGLTLNRAARLREW